jgi:hypothetical protein
MQFLRWKMCGGLSMSPSPTKLLCSESCVLYVSYIWWFCPVRRIVCSKNQKALSHLFVSSF